MKLKPFLQTFGGIAVVLTLFPFVAVDYWWIRIFDYPHVQLTILTLVAFLVYFFRFDIRSWQDYAFVTIILGCFIFQLQKIYPYTPLSSYEVKENENYDQDSSISILVANVLQKNEEHEALLDEILRKDPHFIVLTETNQRWINEVSKALTNYPYKVEVPLPNTYGMAVYSKYQLINTQVKFLVDDGIPSIHCILKLPSNQKIEFHSINPTPPMPQHNPKSTERDAEMMMVAKMAKEAKLPVFVTGDFNDVAWSQTTQLFQEVSGLLDPRIGRGFFNTFNVNSWLLRWPLDHLFVSEEFRLVEIDLGKDIHSDHFPIYAKLSFEPESSEAQKPEPPTKEELKTANEEILEAKKD